MPPAPLALARGFALLNYDEDTSTHALHMHRCIQTHTHQTMRCELHAVCGAGRKGAAACGTVSVSVRQQEQALRHSARRQMQRVHARLMTRTLLRMHRHIQTHTHTPWAVSFRLWGWTQGRCCRRHRVSVSAAAGTGSHAQRKQANAACTCHKPVVWPWVVCMDRCHLSTARMQVNDKQCTRTMETGRAWPRLVSIHDRD